MNHADRQSLSPSHPKLPPLPPNYLPAHPFRHGHDDVRDEVAVSGVWDRRDAVTIRNELGREFACAENTLVIFTSDNGPHNESKHDFSRFQPSGPLAGIKRSLTDGGIRVPCLAWWPGKVKPGTISSHVGYFGDWMATAVKSGSRRVKRSDAITLSEPAAADRPVACGFKNSGETDNPQSKRKAKR